jgi:hypothetical protein
MKDTVYEVFRGKPYRLKRCKARRLARTQSRTSIDIKKIGGAVECSVVYEHVFLERKTHTDPITRLHYRNQTTFHCQDDLLQCLERESLNLQYTPVYKSITCCTRIYFNQILVRVNNLI